MFFVFLCVLGGERDVLESFDGENQSYYLFWVKACKDKSFPISNFISTLTFVEQIFYL